MRVRFWGTRGSLPASLDAAAVRAKVRAALLRASGRGFASEAEADAFLDAEIGFAGSGTFGGDSSCVQVDGGDGEYVVCDAGSGLRKLGNHALAGAGGKRLVFNLLLSHVHWDHICGFPFFAPAYVPGNLVRIHGCHDPEGVLRAAFERQQSFPCFPVEFARLGATIEFVPLAPGRACDIGGFRVTAHPQRHPFDSYGYRFEKDGRAVVYSTDSEHKEEAIDASYPQVAFFRGADLVIFDAQYSLAEATGSKEDWGHSSNIVGVELCQLAGAKRLALFHHDPGLDDAAIEAMLEETVRFEALSRRGAPLEVVAAYDGMVLEVE